MTYRTEALERDNHECQFCKMFGIPKLVEQASNGTEWIPDDRLEVHHKRYPARDADDLITVCLRCHDVVTDYVRSYRYGAQEHVVETTRIIKPELVQIETRRYTDGNDTILTDRNRPDVTAQRSARRPTKPVDASNQTNLR